MNKIVNINIFKKHNTGFSIVKEVIKNIFLALIFSIVFAFAFGYEFLNVISHSMTPTMPVGTLVIIKDIDYDKVEVGDAITYLTAIKKDYVTHRVVGIEKSTGLLVTAPESTWLQHKDNGPINDPSQISNLKTITKSEYVGTVVMHFKGFGNTLNFVKNNVELVVISAILLLFVINFL